MSDESFDKTAIRQMAVDTFNQAWTLMEMETRTPEVDDELIATTHASRYLWGLIGEPVNLARGDWQISRVYTVLGRAEPALHHARRCLQILEDNGIGDWDLGFAHEALARAHALDGNRNKAMQHLELGREIAATVKDEADGAWLIENLDDIQL